MNHPLTLQRWIWPEGYMYLYNHFAQFRRDLVLAADDPKALLHITADKSYKLFINGQYVCRGPARGYQEHWPFDTVPVGHLLRKGHNWISVEAYNPGISTFCYLHLTRAGLLCAPQGKQLEKAWEKSQWQFRRSPAHATQTARLSLQIDFQEHVDMNQDDRSWIRSADAPAGWDGRIFDPQNGMHYLSQPFGTPPYANIEPRGIPLLREWIRGPRRILRAAGGPSAGGWRDTQNVSWHWDTELLAIGENWRDGAQIPHKLLDDGLELTLPPTGAGKFCAVGIDVGDFAAANLIVEADGATGGEVLDFQYDQADAKHLPRSMRPGQGCNAAMSSRLRLAPGDNRHEFYQLLGFQHLTIIARELSAPLTVRLKLRCAGYPFTFNGQFTSSDQELDEIRRACQRTQQLCAWDAYVDTPWREQAQWWGDARVQACNTFHMDGDARLLARGIRSLAGQICPQGLTYGHAPTSSDWCILPDFSLTWVLTIWDYYFQTGDADLFVEQYPAVRRVMDYFRSPATLAANGLLQYDPRFWLFEDWSTLPKETYPCFLNLWYLLTLRHVEKLCRVAGMKGEIAHWKKLADDLRQKILGHFLDRKSGLLRPALDQRGKPTGEPSVHDQTLALMLDLLPDSQMAILDKVLLPFVRGQEIAGAKASAFWSFYTLRELGKLGFAREAIDFIRRGWGPMLPNGTTWEGFDSGLNSGSSTCHAWTSHPAVHFNELLGGIRQAAPAWRQVDFAPVFVSGIDHCDVSIPTPQGMIRSTWRRDGAGIQGELSVPKGVKASIRLPGQKPRTHSGGKFAWKVDQSSGASGE